MNEGISLRTIGIEFPQRPPTGIALFERIERGGDMPKFKPDSIDEQSRARSIST
jgi:hypothetical protein